MKQLPPIETCEACPYVSAILTANSWLDCCGKMKPARIFKSDQKGIPDWCPLPDADDKQP